MLDGKETESERINLFMAGGGTRLSAYVGALAACQEMGVEVVSVAGASAGSIIAGYLATGWSVEQMYHLVMHTRFAQFKDFSLRALLFQNGVYSGNRFEKWMNDQLKGARFKDVQRNLYVTAIDLIEQQPVIFSSHTAPDMTIAKAVRFSMSFPWVWSAQRWNGKVLVDGNLIPWIPKVIEVMEANWSPVKADRTVTLRLVMDASARKPIKTHLWPWEFTRILLGTMGAALENQRVPGQLWRDTVLISTGNISTLQFTLTQADQEELFRLGYEQVRRYLHKKRAIVAHAAERG